MGVPEADRDCLKNFGEYCPFLWICPDWNSANLTTTEVEASHQFPGECCWKQKDCLAWRSSRRSRQAGYFAKMTEDCCFQAHHFWEFRSNCADRRSWDLSYGGCYLFPAGFALFYWVWTFPYPLSYNITFWSSIFPAAADQSLFCFSTSRLPIGLFQPSTLPFLPSI